MVKLAKTSPTEDLQGAIDKALRSGMDGEAIANVVSERIMHQQLATDTLAGYQYTTPDEGLLIYDELPPGLIDLPSAGRKYGCHRARLRNWVMHGHLKVYGRLKAPARGGGYIVVSESELKHRLATVSTKGGRPRKTSTSGD